jgi:hypothetical protein
VYVVDLRWKCACVCLVVRYSIWPESLQFRPLKRVACVCRVNDRIISANGVSLENVEYATAVQVLRDSGNTVLLVVRRRVVLPACPEPQTLKLSLTKSKKKDGKLPCVR